MLKVIGLGKEYKDKVALNDINLTFPEKGLVIIKGESGCGKSTLLNLLTASDMSTYGKIIFEGVEITPKNYETYRLKYCSNIYQDYMLLEDLTVGENIELALQACGQNYTADDIKDILQSVGIAEEYIGKKASKLSGGEKQRVAIARAISKKNAMIFADEPTGNLDSKNGDMVMEILKDISKERLVVVVSHNERQNAMFGDYFVELFDGVVKSQNLPEKDNCDDKKDIELQKSSGKLKPKSIARLAFWGFEKNRIKTVVTIIAVIAMCVLNIVSTVALVGDINLALAKSLEKCEGKNVFVEFSTYEHIEDVIDYGDAKKKFQENIDYGYLDVWNFEIGPDHYEKDIEEQRKDKYVGYIRRAIIYNSQVGVDVKVLYGDFPKKPNDIMLPSFYAEYMSRVFYDFKCNDIKDLVGKELRYNSSGMRDLANNIDYYPFNICGIFDEGAFLNDYENLSDINSRYLDSVNLMAGCVILAPNADKVIFNNAYVFNSTGFGYNTLVDFYPTNIGDALIIPYCYDEYSDYALSYAPLEEGEVYLDVDVASEYGISAGDRVDLSTWEYQHKQGGGLWDFEPVEVDRICVTVKQLIDLPEKNSFAIFNQQDYVDILIKQDNSDHTWGYYFNTKNIKDNYAFFNKISAQAKKTGLIIYGLNNSGFTENSSALHSLYNLFIEYRYFLILPIMVLSLVGIVALGFVSLSYLISSKGKSYNILRSLGFGKSHIASILAVQVFAVILVECIFGIACGALSCFLFGKSFVALVDAGVTLSVANEVVMPMGYVAPLVVTMISLIVGGIMTLVKTKTLFAKSIIENKTN